MLEATEIKIRGADCDKLIVNNHCFAVEHTFLVKVYLDSGAQALSDVGERSIAQKPGIVFAGEHYSDIYVR